jgi:hypothetical protein
VHRIAVVVRLKVMGKLLIAMLLGLSLSCASKQDPMHGDVSFTAEERSAIERGNVFIAERVGQEPYDIVWDLPHPTDPSSGGALTIVRGCSRPTFSGTGEINGHVEIAPDRLVASGSTEDLAVIAAHEFGHTRRLQHLPADVAGLMNPSTEHSLVWTDADQAKCLADGICKP